MPVLVEPDTTVVESLLKAMPAGAHAVTSAERMNAWLTQHPDEYVVVLGPGLDLETTLHICSDLRTARPTVSPVLVVDTVATAVLARAIKAGARDVVGADEPDALEAAVRQAYELHVALRGAGGAAHSGRVVTVFSPKGGVGKTTMAVNLALALTDKGARRVCLVDLDLAFGDVAITMQLFPTHSIEQAIGADDVLDIAMLESLLTRHQDSLMVLAAPAHPDVRERITPALVSRVLRTLAGAFDFVVVDTSPSFDDQVLTALDESDECVIVATLDVPTLKNVKVALETLEMLDVAEGHRHLLLNRADDAVGISAEKVEAILGMEVTARVTTSIDVAAATNAGAPIVASSPHHPVSATIVELASRLTGQTLGAPDVAAHAPGGPDAADAPSGRGLFRRRKGRD